MIDCPCCESDVPSDFPDECEECGARFEHEGEVRNGDWKPVVYVAHHGSPCVHRCPRCDINLIEEDGALECYDCAKARRLDERAERMGWAP